MTFANKVIRFNKQLDFNGELPPGIRIMNPFKENPQVISIMEQFYKKFYDDNAKRHLILGINPGRFGGGVTGIPFTDSKRLKSICKIDYQGKETHEPSSVFIYEMIAAFGGTERFYKSFTSTPSARLALPRQRKVAKRSTTIITTAPHE